MTPILFLAVALVGSGTAESDNRSPLRERFAISQELLNNFPVTSGASLSEANALTENTFFFEDPTNQASVETILLKLNQFQPLPEGGPNFGLSASTFWFFLRLDLPTATEAWVLNFPYAPLDHIAVFASDGGHVQLGGDRQEFSKRFMPHRTSNFAIPSSRDDLTEWVLFKVETETSVQAHFELYTQERFGMTAAEENAGLYLYYGIFLVMILFNFTLFLQLRDQVYLPYLGYLITQPLFHMCMNGTFMQRFVPSSPEIASPSLTFFGLTSLGFTLIFALQFNRTDTQLPRTYSAFKYLAWLYLALGLSSFVLPYKAVVIPLVIGAIVIPALDLFCGVVALRAGYTPARFYVVGWGVFILLTIGTALKAAGLLPSNFLTNYGGQIGSATEAILLTLALGDRMQAVRRERDRLNIENLQASEALAEESLMRSEAERRARIEAETKVMVFSDAVHHLNNPLNHIVGSNRVTQNLSTHLKGRLNDLLHTDPIDPETEQVRLDLDKQVQDINLQLKTIKEASSRASDTVSLLRIVSGIDGTPFSKTKAGEIFEIAMRRLPGSQSKLIPLLDTQADTSVIGHPALYAQAIELVERALEKCGTPELPMTLEPHDDTVTLTWKASPDRGLNLIEQDSIAKASELIEHLLRPYQCRLMVSETMLALEFCRHGSRLANDQPGSALVR